MVDHINNGGSLQFVLDINGDPVPVQGAIDSGGKDAVRVVAEVTAMAATPGDDDTNNVKVVEQGRFTLKRLLNSGSHDLGAAGAIGDYLNHIYFPRAPQGTKVGLVYLKDGGTIVSQFEFDPAGEGIIAGITIPINAVSEIGTWTIQIVDNNSVAEVVAVGRFTD